VSYDPVRGATGQVNMAQHRLNISNVRSSFEHKCCHRVTKDMTRAALPDTRRSHVLTSKPTEVIRCEWDAVRSQEYNSVIWFLRDLRSQAIKIQVQPGQCSITDRYHAVSLAFSFANSYEAVFLVHVV